MRNALLLAVPLVAAAFFTAPPVPNAIARRALAVRALEDEPGGALAASGSQLEQALGSLPPDEKYNAVLISLLSGGANSASALELVTEMSAKRLTLSGEALKALVDAAVSEGTPESLSLIHI